MLYVIALYKSTFTYLLTYLQRWPYVKNTTGSRNELSVAPIQNSVFEAYLGWELRYMHQIQYMVEKAKPEVTEWSKEAQLPQSYGRCGSAPT